MTTPEMDPDTLADLADATADLLERDGWIQGWFTRPDGHCAIGAAKAVGRSHHQERYFEVVVALSGHLGLEFVPGGMHPVAEWNDEEGRTKDEVVQAFRDLAVKTRPDATGGA